MIKQLLILSFLFVVFKSFAQFAIVEDKDGFVNVRKSPGIKNNIVDTIYNGEFVFIWDFDDELKNWFSIIYIKNDHEKDGYIYKTKFKELNKFQEISNKNFIYGGVVLKSDSIKITIKVDSFQIRKNKIEYEIEENSYKFVKKINNKKFYGTDGEVPSYQYKSIEIEFGKDNIVIPKSAFKDLFEPNINNTNASYDPLTQNLYIYALNSNGAWSYGILWIIKNKKYLKRVLYGDLC
jgi:hypothetical protein